MRFLETSGVTARLPVVFCSVLYTILRLSLLFDLLFRLATELSSSDMSLLSELTCTFGSRRVVAKEHPVKDHFTALDL